VERDLGPVGGRHPSHGPVLFHVTLPQNCERCLRF
jgi:hypothetical protein